MPIGVRGTDRAAWPLGEPSAECCLDTLCVCCLRWCGAGLLAGFSLARRATFLDDRRFFFLSICTRGWCRRARLSSARGGLSRMVLSARCGCRRAHLTPPIAPCAHLHGAEPLGGMQQHSRKESPGLPSSLVGCKCVPNLGRVRFFAVPCPARTRASPAPRNAFLLIHPCVRMVCNAFCAGAAMQG